MRKTAFLAILLFVIGIAPSVEGRPAAQAPAATPQAPAKSDDLGVRNFTRVDASFACGGALSSLSVDVRVKK